MTTTPRTATTSPSRKARGPQADQAPRPQRRRSLRQKTQVSTDDAMRSKQLTKVRGLERAGAFEWWNATRPKSLDDSGACGGLLNPNMSRTATLVYEGQPVKLTPRQEELATFYASCRAGRGCRERRPARDLPEELLGRLLEGAGEFAHHQELQSCCDFTRISEPRIGRKRSVDPRPDAEKKTMKK